MKKCKIYLTEYTKYDPLSGEDLIFAGPTILALNIIEAESEIKEIYSWSLINSELRIINA